MTGNQEARRAVHMALTGEAMMLPSKGGYQETWKNVFQANLDALFQFALLSTADLQEAEANLVAVTSTLDLSKHPDEDASAVTRTALVRQSIGSGGSFPRPELRKPGPCFNPVYCLSSSWSASPRVCFVLRMLFGYTTSACAVMLGIDEGGVKTLLRVAVLQLHHARSMHIDGRPVTKVAPAMEC
jgi:hypothetical protein